MDLFRIDCDFRNEPATADATGASKVSSTRPYEAHRSIPRVPTHNNIATIQTTGLRMERIAERSMSNHWARLAFVAS